MLLAEFVNVATKRDLLSKPAFRDRWERVAVPFSHAKSEKHLCMVFNLNQSGFQPDPACHRVPRVAASGVDVGCIRVELGCFSAEGVFTKVTRMGWLFCLRNADRINQIGLRANYCNQTLRCRTRSDVFGYLCSWVPLFSTWAYFWSMYDEIWWILYHRASTDVWKDLHLMGMVSSFGEVSWVKYPPSNFWVILHGGSLQEHLMIDLLGSNLWASMTGNVKLCYTRDTLAVGLQNMLDESDNRRKE